MRHKYAGYKLKRPVDSRNALLRNLTTSVIENERIVTTVPKAKAVRPWVEKMITLAGRLEEEPHVNPSTGTSEFSLRDPDGYYVTISSV